MTSSGPTGGRLWRHRVHAGASAPQHFRSALERDRQSNSLVAVGVAGAGRRETRPTIDWRGCVGRGSGAATASLAHDDRPPKPGAYPSRSWRQPASASIREIWEKVVQKLQRQPDAAWRPAAAGRGDLSRPDLVSRNVARQSRRQRAPIPGRTEALHRLNRAEYRNAVRDLLALDIDVSSMLPADDVELRLRQHRRRAADVADADGALSRLRRRRSAPSRSARRRGRRPPRPSSFRRSCGRTIGSRVCRSARAAAPRCATRFRETANTRPRSAHAIRRRQLRRHSRSSIEPQRLELSVDGKPLHVFELRPDAAERRPRTRPRTEPAGRSMPTGRSGFRRRPARERWR